jgi:hypothetical protein
MSMGFHGILQFFFNGQDVLSRLPEPWDVAKVQDLGPLVGFAVSTFLI